METHMKYFLVVWGAICLAIFPFVFNLVGKKYWRSELSGVIGFDAVIIFFVVGCFLPCILLIYDYLERKEKEGINGN